MPRNKRRGRSFTFRTSKEEREREREITGGERQGRRGGRQGPEVKRVKVGEKNWSGKWRKRRRMSRKGWRKLVR
jgi:hypothetical protein